jgi:hypothetical protein
MGELLSAALIELALNASMMPATMAPIVLFIVYISSPYYLDLDLDLDLINHQLNQTENFLTITNCI